MKTLTSFFVIAILTASLFAAEPKKVQIAASPETTYYVSPQLPDGRIDYQTILHNLCFENTTKENNIVAILYSQFAGETERQLLIAAANKQEIDAEAEERIHRYREKAWRQLGFDTPPDWKTLQFGFFPYDEPAQDFKQELLKHYSPEELEKLADACIAQRRENYRRHLESKTMTQEEFDSTIKSMEAERYNTLVNVQWADALRDLWTEKDSLYLAEGIKKTDALTRQLIECSKQTEYSHPYFALGESELLHDATLSYVQSFRDVSRFLILRGHWDFTSGNIDQAFECAFANIRLGNTVRKGSGWLVEELVGNAFDGIGINQITRYLAQIDGKKDAKWILQKKKEYETLFPIAFSDPPTWIAGERILTLNAIQELIVGHKEIFALLDEEDKKRFEETFTPDKEYDWNDILRRCNLFYDDYEEMLRIPDGARRLRAAKRLAERIKELRDRYETEQDPTRRAGDLIMAVFTFPVDIQIASAHCRTEMLYDSTRVAFALAVYRSEHDGKNPETLAELVPKYMESIPLSPFSGKPLRYIARKDVCFIASTDKYKFDGSEPEVEKAIAETPPGNMSNFPFDPSAEHFVFVLWK